MTNGGIGVATSIIIPKWFIAKRGRAVAVGSVGSQMGSAITPLYVQILVSTSGWRIAAVVAGVTIWVVSLIPSALFLRRQPEDMGLLPDGAQPGETDLRNSRAERREPSISLSIADARKTSALYLLTICIATSWVIRTGTPLHMIPYFTDHGFSDSLAVTVLVIYSSSGAVGAIFWGFLSDRLGARMSLTIDCLLIGCGMLFLLVASHSLVLAVIWAIFWGITLTGQMTLQRVIFADYYGRGRLGSIQGVVTAFQTVAQAAGPIIAALVYDSLESYTWAFVGFAVGSFVGAICVALAKPPDKQPQTY